ncbi:MAG: 16S rRNA (cytosine(967)-C(5))-methyltransferase, partial [Gammaproteobacteria bacterium]|nr:16S rRNA (cytosine(967)-C(5))-methyltransferase [Gammaproteobacteria bacterium]
MSKRGAPAGAAVRAEAAKITVRVARDGASLDDALAALPDLAERDAALVRALAFGACRWHHRLEWQAGRLLSRPLARRDAALAALIRIGLLQLQTMRVPDHAAVSATVEAAPLVGASRAKGLVNAVLRRFLRERGDLDRRMAGVPAARYSHPEWLIDAVRSDWPEAWEAILDANNVPPPMWLRVNARRADRDDYVRRLAEVGIEAEASPLGAAAVLLAEPRPMSQLPGYESGEVSVQDAAAQLAAELLDPAPGDRVLDACAAPGGKTAHVLERCPDLRELWALDRDASRLETVRTTLARLGLAAKLVHADATKPAEWWDG